MSDFYYRITQSTITKIELGEEASVLWVSDSANGADFRDYIVSRFVRGTPAEIFLHDGTCVHSDLRPS